MQQLANLNNALPASVTFRCEMPGISDVRKCTNLHMCMYIMGHALSSSTLSPHSIELQVYHEQ